MATYPQARLSQRDPAENIKFKRRYSAENDFGRDADSTTGHEIPLVHRLPVDNVNYFPHLPPYTDPNMGVLSKLPPSWVPYAQLMRLDRPAGFYAFYLPYVIGILYAACISPQTPSPPKLLSLAAIMIPYNLLLRGAACAWNDNVDQEFDRQVVRCRHRPVARGAVTTVQTHVFTVALILAGYPIIACLPAPCMPQMLIIIVLFSIYAIMKRVTYYPQVVLGFPFAWAIFFCIAALGMEPFGQYRLPSTFALFAANCLWTVTYDTIYAHQDIGDDEKAGVKGMAVKFKSTTKLLTSVLVSCQVALLTLCGWWAGFDGVYYIGTVGGVTIAMAYFIYSVDLSSPESCGYWFCNQFWTVGAGFVAGLGAEYCVKVSA
ncbi:UbiA prenyltransferase family-domain-containing protein [Penicillium nucicola]|uniref:UbiA prenyltransferase family-domain-containing protein n=1 Tax=Penicillium nucicola TaxID=1850975 RepID=UPI00254534C8|nr:UbiA prenyltransferase family-domain-containing protein [Penicillium nucicola]KAJ5767120.1 UbiA prenyltransferase family-domain-containing protein [Penicillium nucicola]